MRCTRFALPSPFAEARSDHLHSLRLLHLWTFPTQALDLPDLPPRLRGKCLSALCRICRRQALLPRSLKIPICYNRSATPLYRGGFADVWKGEYQGRYVAVKVLRVYSTSDIGKIVRVSLRTPAKMIR